MPVSTKPFRNAPASVAYSYSWYVPLIPCLSRAFLKTDRRQEMLSSYSDVIRRHCQKCNKIFDFGAKFPVVRVRKQRVSSEATNPAEWQALHMGCYYGAGT